MATPPTAASSGPRTWGARFAGLPSVRMPAGAGLLAIAIALGLLLGRFAFAGGRDDLVPATAAAPASSLLNDATLESLQIRIRANPDDAPSLTRLAAAYLARSRETGDPTWYTKADEALARSRSLEPSDLDTLIVTGLLQLTRHDFAGALATGRGVVTVNASSIGALGVVTDALVELGRYPEAVDAAQRMVDVRPGLPSYARASYLRELHGDSRGALAAMRQALADGGSRSDNAYIGSLVGDLELGGGQLDAAARSYRAVLATSPGYGAAEVGMARIAAARGDFNRAIARLEPLARRLPLPATVSLLGDVYAAASRSADARRQYALVRVIERLNQANGVAIDLELARFEADHARDPDGDPVTAVALATRALEQRPTIYGHDALAWALRQAGRPAEALPHARAATSLGTQDALVWYHRAAIEADLGQRADATRDLRRALSVNRFVSVRDAADVRRLGEALGVGGRR